jgi:hypothetical protein
MSDSVAGTSFSVLRGNAIPNFHVPRLGPLIDGRTLRGAAVAVIIIDSLPQLAPELCARQPHGVVACLE